TTRTGIEEGRAWHRIQVTEARVLVNRQAIPKKKLKCYYMTCVTNGNRRSAASLRPVLDNVDAMRARKLYVFEKDRLETYRALRPPQVHHRCGLTSATTTR